MTILTEVMLLFDSETTVHIGADEFLDNYSAYRNFINTIIPYVKQTNTVRMWGGLTWIKDNRLLRSMLMPSTVWK